MNKYNFKSIFIIVILSLLVCGCMFDNPSHCSRGINFPDPDFRKFISNLWVTQNLHRIHDNCEI